MIGAVQAIGIVTAFTITWTCGSVWHTGRRRKRAMEQAEADAWKPYPELPNPRIARPDSRPQVPHDSDGGRP